MSDVAAELGTIAQGLAQEPPPAPAASVTLRPPLAADGAIDPQWRRPAEAGPTPDQLRSQGFRRGLVAGGLVFLALAAGFVFFVLPDWVERGAVSAKVETAPAAAAQPGPAATAAPDLRQLAESKQVFDDTRAELARRYQELETRGAGVWGRDGFASAARKLADGDAAAAQREYPKAIESLRAAAADLQAVAELAVSRLKDALAAGAAALDAGDEAETRRQFGLALQIEPTNAIARRGLERADSIVEVKRLLAEAEALERSGQSTEAEAAYRKALQLDRDTAAALAGLARVQSQASSAAFAAAISQGLGGLARKDFAAAKAAFERAGRIRPGAPEVVDGLAQVERAVGDQSIGAHLAAAGQAERAERWSVALTEYRKALDIDRNLLAAQQGVERAEPRAMLDGELSAYLERPERLFAPEVRNAARTAVQRAKGIATPGPVLTGQVSAVERLIADAETPMRFALASDNQTEVTIYRVGRLGAFERKDMELLPGRYTVVGVRPGYRDVRRELTLLPGSAAPTLVIRCEEPI
jgi:tetratricopeptide (TPR) repeat protein